MPKNSKGNGREKVVLEAELMPSPVAEATVTLRCGVVLGLREVSPLIIQDKLAKLEKERPKVPRQFIEGKGREEENPTHPEYLSAMEEFDRKRAAAAYDTLLVMGTHIVSLPDGFDGPDSDSWLETLNTLDIEVSNPTARYLAWVKYKAIDSVGDLVKVNKQVVALSAVPEEEVAEAAESFRG